MSLQLSPRLVGRRPWLEEHLKQRILVSRQWSQPIACILSRPLPLVTLVIGPLIWFFLSCLHGKTRDQRQQEGREEKKTS